MDEAVIKRVLPHSIEAEQSVIGSMLMDRDAIVTASEQLSAEDFYHQQYGVMFEAMTELYSEGKPVDLVTLQDRLNKKNIASEALSMEAISTLVNNVPTSANIKQYARIVYEKSMLRKLIKINEEIENECYLGKEKMDDIMELTEKKVFGLLRDRSSGDFVPVSKIALDVLERIEAASKNNSPVTGIPTGFTDLDYKTSGLQPSDLILIAARPSMGKTAFVLNIAQYVTLKKNFTTAIFSLEMSKEQLVNRLFSMVIC